VPSVDAYSKASCSTLDKSTLSSPRLEELILR
jgi:hypothetical protein